MYLPTMTELKQWRVRLGLTQRKVSMQVGIKQPYLAKIEAGEGNPAYALVARLVEHYSLQEAAMERVGDKISTWKVVSVLPSDTVRKAGLLMRANGFSQLPVIDEKDLNVGSVNERDLMDAQDAFGKGKAPDVAVERVMKEPFPEIDAGASVAAVRGILRFRQLALVKKKGKIAGVVTASDML